MRLHPMDLESSSVRDVGGRFSERVVEIYIFCAIAGYKMQVIEFDEGGSQTVCL